MAKRTKNGNMSVSELETRRYHRSVKRVQRWCEDQNIKLHSWSEAGENEQCVLSTIDYELGAYREYISEDNESYFVSEEDYQQVSNEALYL